MKAKTRTSIALALATGGIVAASVPAFAVTAATIESVGPRVLVAKGAAVTVPVTFTCDAGLTYNVNVGLTQRVSKETAVGSAQTGGDCSGSSQAETLTIRPERARFKTGVALAGVSIGVCDPDFSCANADLDQEISIKNK